MSNKHAEQLTLKMHARVRNMTLVTWLIYAIVHLPIRGEKKAEWASKVFSLVKAQYRINKGEWRSFDITLDAVWDGDGLVGTLTQIRR